MNRIGLANQNDDFVEKQYEMEKQEVRNAMSFDSKQNEITKNLASVEQVVDVLSSTVC